MTKIYAQGNYIVIEANNERTTFQKKGVGFEIVNDDGLYILNYKELPIGYFNYSDVKKEDGSDYATPLEFETFLFENTGNFNSGADVSPNYIPLTGTEEGKPVTGNIIVTDGFSIQKKNGNGYDTFQLATDSTYSQKKFVTDEGYQITNGTANQSLTADGGVFDLNTKADLVGGKVPQSQLPSSNKTTFTHDILVSNWTLVSGKYEAVISNAGILSNSFVDVIPSNDNVDIVRNAQIYPSVLISEGSVKVYSKFLPSGTISVTLNIN